MIRHLACLSLHNIMFRDCNPCSLQSLDGPHHYQIADHGGLLVAVPANTSTPNVVKFSTDEGRCWHTYKFTDVKLIFTGLLTEPGNKAMTVGIWGYGAEDRKWRVYVIDFKEVINRQCGSICNLSVRTSHTSMKQFGGGLTSLQICVLFLLSFL